MAVVSTFKADFSDFLNKAKQAEGSLEKLQDAAGSTARSVTSMGNSFSGEKIIRQATDAVQAIRDMGGVSALSEKEMARVNATITEAIAKMKALGIQAPADLTAMKNATQGAADKLSVMGQSLEAVKGYLANVFGPAAIAATIGRAFTAFTDLTGKLTDLSGKTGISTTALQKLGYVTEQSGVTIDQVSQAVTKMGRNLVEGDKSAVEGIKALGLNVGDLVRMAPDQAFMAIGDAIGKVENPMERAALATKVFGKAGADLLPTFTGNLKDLGDQAEESGAIMSEDVVKAGDDAGDALGRLKTAGMSLIGNMLGPLVPAITAAADWLGKALPAALNFARNAFDKMIEAGLTVKMKFQEIALSIMELTQKVPVLGEKFGFSKQSIDGMRASIQESKDTITAFTTQAVEPATKTLAAVAPVVGKYGEETGKAARQTKSLTDELTGEGAIKKVQALQSAFLSLTPAQQANATIVENTLERYIKLRNEVGANLTPALEKLFQQTGTLHAKTLDLGSGMASLPPVLQSTGEQIRNLAAGFAADGTLIAGGFTTAKGAVVDLNEALMKLPENVKPVGTALLETARTSTSMFAGVMAGLPNVIMDALKGGGSVVGASGSFIGSTLMENFSKKFGPAIKAALPFGIGEAVTALLPTLGALFGPVAEKIAGFFKSIFGGPSQDELRGRQAVADFEKQLASLLTQTQQTEAGGESWKQTVIAIRDAYIAAGRSEQEALADAKRLWESSKKSAEESARVIAEIEAKMKAQGEAAVKAVKSVEDAIDQLPEDVNINVHGNYIPPDIPGDNNPDSGYATGTKGRTGSWFKNFGAGTSTTLHGDEAVVRRDQAGDFAAAFGGSGGVVAELAGLRSDFAALPNIIARAVRDAILVSG